MRHALTRLLAAGALSLAAGTLAAPAPARADDHSYVTITGIDLVEPITVTAEDQPERYAAVRTEVNWLISRSGNAPEPDSGRLGPQYTLVLHVDGEPRHRFHLYPVSEGGPRVFRPADQPADEQAPEAWFYGRLSLPETLTDVGVPLAGAPPDVRPGGGNDDEADEPERGPLAFLAEWREGMLLTAGVTLALLAGVASVAFLLRREP